MRLICLTTTLLFKFFITTSGFAETGVFSRKIILATNQPLSGPAQEYSFVGKSAKAFFQYVNDQGGVHGRNIKLKIVDDQLRPEKANQKIIELSIKKNIFAIFSGLGNETFRAVYPFLKQQTIPSFFVGSDLPEFTRPVRTNVFGFLPTANTEARVLGKYLTKNQPGTEIIIWYADKPLYLRSVKALTKELFGVSAKLLPGKKGRLSAEWKLIIKRRPDLLIALGNFNDLMIFLKSSPKLNIPVFTGHALADSRITDWLQSDVYSFVRVLTAFPLVVEKDHPGVVLHKKILKEYLSIQNPNRWTIYGHAVAELMVEVLNRAGRKLTRQKAISSAETIKKWKGKLMPTVYLDSTNHLALTSFRVSKIKPSSVKHLSDWIDGR